MRLLTQFHSLRSATCAKATRSLAFVNTVSLSAKRNLRNECRSLDTASAREPDCRRSVNRQSDAVLSMVPCTTFVAGALCPTLVFDSSMIPLTTDVAGAFCAFAADASAPGWLIVFSSAKLPAVGSGRRRPESLLCAQQSRAHNLWERIPKHQWMRSAPGKGRAVASLVCGSSCPFTPGQPCCCDLSFIVNTQ